MKKQTAKRMMKPAKAELEKVFQDFVAIKEEMAALSKQQKALGELIKERLRAEPSGHPVVGDVRASLSEVAGSEKFNLKNARKEIDEKILKPFIYLSKASERLLVTREDK